MSLAVGDVPVMVHSQATEVSLGLWQSVMCPQQGLVMDKLLTEGIGDHRDRWQQFGESRYW